VVASGLLPGAIEIMDRLAIQAAVQAVGWDSVPTGSGRSPNLRDDPAGAEAVLIVELDGEAEQVEREFYHLQRGRSPNLRDDPANAEAVLIVELDGEAEQVEREFYHLQRVIEDSHACEVRIAESDEQRLKIWKGRKGAFSAVGRLSPDYVVQDGVVPRGKLGRALAEVNRLSRDYGLRVANVFHAGDGNLHPLILYDGKQPGALEQAEELAAKILRYCVELGGSITGEHGVGMEKRACLPAMFSDVDMEIMRQIRREMDPQEIANRGKMFPEKKPEAASKPPTTLGADLRSPPKAK